MICPMTDSKRGSEFIRLYNELDHAVKKIVNEKGSVPFWKRLRMAAKVHPHIRRNLDELLEIHELRNAIVHHRSYPATIIAIPTAEIVDKLAEVVAELSSPELLMPAFKRQIHVFSSTSPLHESLAYMKRQGFRQIVLKAEGQLALITSKGIANWLLGQADGKAVVLSDATLGDLLPFEETGSVEFLAQDSTIDTARQIFDIAQRSRPRHLFAVLVTKTGLPTEDPLGIITPRDLLALENKPQH